MSDSIWKKEIRLRKKPEPLPPLPARLLKNSRVREQRPAGTVVVPVVPAGDPFHRVEHWTSRAEAERPTPVQFPKPTAGEGQDPVALLPVRAASDPAPIAPPLPAPASSYGWTKPAEPESADTQAVAAVSASEPPAPPALEEQKEEKVPLLKREISFKRKPKPEIVSLEPVAATTSPVFEAQKEEKVPLLKREISFKRKPKPEAVASEPVVEEAPATEIAATIEPEPELAPEPEPVPVVSPTWSTPAVPVPVAVEPEPAAEPEPEPEPTAGPAAQVDPAPATEKVPLLKREISFKRKPKAAKEPKREKPRKEKAPKGERRPSLKRAIRIPRPQRRVKGGGRGTQRVVGLRIGSSQLVAAHVQNNGHAELVQLAHVPIDRGLVVAGEVRDSDALSRALKDFFGKNNLPRKDVRLGLASTRIGVRVLDVPAIEEPKLFENALRFRAQEVLPISVTDAVLDHVDLGEIQNDEGVAMRRVLLVFAHRELVNRFVDVCRGAGIRLSGIDLDAFALLRALAPARVDGQTGDRAVVAVAVGHERTVLAVSDGRICDFARVLEWGGGSLDVALARALDLAPSQAEPVKRAMSLHGTEPPDGLTPVLFEAAKSAVRSEIGVLGRELVSSLRFYQGRPDSLPIGEVLLAGGVAQLDGFADELQRMLGAAVRIADPFARVSLGKRVETDATGSVAIAVGLGIDA